MADKRQMGASLEELANAGLTELPAIADAFRGASRALSGISTGGLFTTAGPFSDNNPSSDFAALMSALEAATRKSGAVLDDVAEALVATARDFARTDAEVRDAFVTAGGTL